MRQPVQIAIYIYRVNDGIREYLLLKRTLESGGFWQGVTGGVEDDETVLQTASRELREETGFTNTKLVQINHQETFPVPESMKHHYNIQVHSLTEYAFYTRVKLGVTPVLDPLEHTDFKWVGYQKALEALHFPSNIKALKTCEPELNI